MAKKKDATDDKDLDNLPEGEEGAEGEGVVAPGLSRKKKIIIAAVAVLVLVGGGAGAYFSGLFSNHAADDAAVEAAKINKPVFYTLPEFLVNLNTSTKQSSFLKTTIILELPNATDVIIVEANLPRLVDAMNTYLRELRSSDLAGSAGIQRLREELLLRANKALAPLKINDVLFKEIVVQ